MSNKAVVYEDVVEWMKNVPVTEIVDALEDAGIKDTIEQEIYSRSLANIIATPSFFINSWDIYDDKEERFLVVVHRVEPTDRMAALRLLRKMDYTLDNAKKALTEAPYYFYFTKECPDPWLYYNPAERTIDDGGEYYHIAKDLGFKMLVISSLNTDIETWMETLNDEERKDVIFSLDFYIDIFYKYINNN